LIADLVGMANEHSFQMMCSYFYTQILTMLSKITC